MNQRKRGNITRGTRAALDRHLEREEQEPLNRTIRGHHPNTFETRKDQYEFEILEDSAETAWPTIESMCQ